MALLRFPPSLSASSPRLSSNPSHFLARKPLIGGKEVHGVAMAKGSGGAITGLVFSPFEELKLRPEVAMVPVEADKSLARFKYSDKCEAAVNEQINVEYNNSYIYHAMYAYFDRDNIALRGFAKFFKESSEEEREHAEKLMEYQNKRGGRVKLQSILMPVSEYDHSEKGDALYAMELSLALEKLTNEKLLHLQKVAEQCKDVELMNYIESEFLGEQVEAIKKISEFISQLRRVGPGHGVWHFDQVLLHGDGVHG
ncbi:Ferritin [Rhynchospora pubera]|uniref:Ferritin n=1 Tax=Rhynchospora pubera TaxID=906938 RepID=A0AAV8CDD3_9POAL|nr:Ferritin [Rhynchospora pubera]